MPASFNAISDLSVMRTLTENDRNTLPRGWVRQAVMGVLRWKDVPGGGRADTLQKSATLQVNPEYLNLKSCLTSLRFKCGDVSASRRI